MMQYERDALQTELYSDANRKRRRLEREKRTLERPTPSKLHTSVHVCAYLIYHALPGRAIPPPRPARASQKPQSARELIKCASLDIKHLPSSRLKRKRAGAVSGTTYPKLSVLSRQEIQTDLHQLSVRVRSNYYGTGQIMVPGEMGMGPPLPHGMDGHYPEYGVPLGAPVQTPYPQGHPPYPPQPPPESRNIYHHQPLAPAPAPMNGIPRDPNGPPMSPRQYEHGMVNGGPQYGMTGPGQPYTPPPGASSAGAGPSKQPLVNGHGHGRRVISGNKGERERMMENGVSDEYSGRMQPPSQHPHRHPAMHQSLQVHGVPHHHHIVHRHGAHHHHLPGRSASGPGAPRPPELDRYPSAPEQENGMRRPVAVEQYNLVSKPVSMYKEDPDPGPSRGERERGRSMLGGPSSMMGQRGPQDRERPQVTPFVMTPTQAIQATQSRGPGGASPARRDPWMDERSAYDAPGPHRMGSPSRHPSSHSSPRTRPLASPPLSALPNHIYSPSRIASKSTNSRPISPIPVLSKAYPSGPGTPGSRLGTPGLAGPGTRPDVPTHNGLHTPVSIYSSPGLMGPAQPIVPGEHIVPSAKMVAQLGNGS